MEQQAFHTLALAELDAVYRFAYHLARNPSEAEDLVQETYLKAIKSCDRFVPGEYGIRPWLFKILHNLLNTRLAKGQRDRKLLADYGAEKDYEQRANPAETDHPPKAAISAATTVAGATTTPAINWENVDQRLKAAVLDLPLSYRIVFLLSAVEGMKYREIADLTEVPIGTVMSRLSRGRKILADQLSDLAAENNLRRTPENTEAGNKKPGVARSLEGDDVDQPGKEAPHAT